MMQRLSIKDKVVTARDCVQLDKPNLPNQLVYWLSALEVSQCLRMHNIIPDTHAAVFISQCTQ